MFRSFRAPRHFGIRNVARLLVAIGAVIVLLSMPGWTLIVFGLALALIGWLVLISPRKRRRPRKRW